MSEASTTRHPAADGTDAAAMPVFATERRVLGLPASSWPAIIAPVAIGLIALAAWELIVWARGIPPYVLPGPIAIGQTLVSDWPSLSTALWVTLKIALAALMGAVLVGVLLSVLFTQSKWLEMSLFPYAVVLQVTPIVAIAPLILIYIDSTTAALLICAWIVAFFPILSNTVIGLRSADHNLRDLFTLYRASPWQRLRRLLIPSALPYFIAGLKVAGGLSLIGAVVAEFAAGSAGKETGLASRILESSFRTEIPKMFAALVLVSLTGIAIYFLFNWVARLALGKWHESEMKGDR